MAVTTGPLEQKLRALRESLRDRRFAFRNRTRMDRLLMLPQLELDEHSSEAMYAAAVRDWLLSNGGPSTPAPARHRGPDWHLIAPRAIVRSTTL
jgi:hypothetical protein